MDSCPVSWCLHWTACDIFSSNLLYNWLSHTVLLNKAILGYKVRTATEVACGASHFNRLRDCKLQSFLCWQYFRKHEVKSGAKTKLRNLLCEESRWYHTLSAILFRKSCALTPHVVTTAEWYTTQAVAVLNLYLAIVYSRSHASYI